MDYNRANKAKKKITELESTAPFYMISKDDFFEIRDTIYFLWNEINRKAFDGTDKTNPIIKKLHDDIDRLEAQLSEKNKKECS